MGESETEIENMDFTRMLRETEGKERDDFGMVMLITYHGQDAVDHWMATITKCRTFSTVWSE